MKFTSKKNIEENKGQYTIEFEFEEWQGIVKNAEKKLIDNLEVPGFRKGKAPESFVKKNISDAKILNEAHKVAIDKAWSFAIAQNDELKPFIQPTVNINSLSKTEYSVSFEFDLKPEIKIGEYKNLKVEKAVNEITEADIEDALVQLQQRSAILNVKEDAIVNGDVAIFDFEGFKDGEAFSGGKAENYELEIGSGKFIPGFEEQLIGLKAGDEKEIFVTFPEDYLQKDLASKEVSFKIKIKEVKTKTVPEINDELALDANLDNVNNLEELKVFVKNNLTSQNEAKIKDAFITDLLQEISKTATIHVPESVITKEVLNLQNEFEQKLKEQGVDLAKYMELTNLTEADIQKELHEDAKVRISNYLILEEIMNKENIEVTSDEIEKEITEFASYYKMTPEEVKEKIVDTNIIEEGLKRRKLLDFLYENNG